MEGAWMTEHLGLEHEGDSADTMQVSNAQQ